MRSRSVTITVVILGVVVVVMLLVARDSGQDHWVSYLQGDPSKGGKVFFHKGCVNCHAISGQGGTSAPDLGKSPQRHLSLAQLVGVMWNHAPKMWQAIEETGSRYPQLSERDILDVFAYLYIARYLDESGDRERGRQLLSEKRCDQCHAVDGVGGRVGPDLREWGRIEHTIHWACAMWNHAPAMEEEMEKRGIEWPRFAGNEMVDLLHYVRDATHTPRKNEIELFPADPKRGRRVFHGKGCDHCHAVRGEGPDIAPDLGLYVGSPRTPVQLAGSMWNHSPEMWRSMAERGVERPTFDEREIADLVSYLYALRYFEEPGDADAGREVFEHKRCAQCHDDERLLGPKISRWRGRLSPVTMAYVMWLHGPKMYARTQDLGIEWPTFEGSEMLDLIAYVNRD